MSDEDGHAVRQVRRADHQCALRQFGQHGEVVECPVCLRRWKYTAPGNPAYAGWRRALPSFLIGRWIALLARHLGRGAAG